MSPPEWCDSASSKCGQTETLCFLLMFPCLPTSGNTVAETKFTSQKAKMFPKKFRKIFVVKTLCFLSMFPCLPTSGNTVAETKFTFQKAKMFPNKFRKIFVAETMFLSLPTYFEMFAARKTLFSRLGKQTSTVL